MNYLADQVAIYAEFRRDWPEALKFYEEGVRVLREVITSLFLKHTLLIEPPTSILNDSQVQK